MLIAKFEPRGKNTVDLVLEPSTVEERLLLAAWLGFDENAINATVKRWENGLIQVVTLSASDAR